MTANLRMNLGLLLASASLIALMLGVVLSGHPDAMRIIYPVAWDLFEHHRGVVACVGAIGAFSGATLFGYSSHDANRERKSVSAMKADRAA